MSATPGTQAGTGVLEDGKVVSEARPSPQDLLKAAVSSPAFWPGVLIFAGFLTIYWPLIASLRGLWLGEDGYYSHGFLVPFIAGFIVYKWWPRIKDVPAKPFYPAVILLLAIMWVTQIAVTNLIDGVMSVMMLAAGITCVWILAGFRWSLILTGPILYLGFALPLFTQFINDATNPLQVVSTKVAYELLKIAGFQLYMDGNTFIYMNNFQLNVDVPCSGLKLVVALAAFTVFFVMIARLNWISNLIMLVMVLPLAIFINGLRIALIGIVGETMGRDAGMQFHDYSGYITLLVCFYIIFKISRILGWKD